MIAWRDKFFFVKDVSKVLVKKILQTVLAKNLKNSLFFLPYVFHVCIQKLFASGNRIECPDFF